MDWFRHSCRRSGAYHYMIGATLEKLGDKGAAQDHYAEARSLSGSLEQATREAQQLTSGG